MSSIENQFWFGTDPAIHTFGGIRIPSTFYDACFWGPQMVIYGNGDYYGVENKKGEIIIFAQNSGKKILSLPFPEGQISWTAELYQVMSNGYLFRLEGVSVFDVPKIYCGLHLEEKEVRWVTNFTLADEGKSPLWCDNSVFFKVTKELFSTLVIILASISGAKICLDLKGNQIEVTEGTPIAYNKWGVDPQEDNDFLEQNLESDLQSQIV